MAKDQTERCLQVLHAGGTEDETCITFVLNGEDHTLGNALRHMIMKNPQVKFCGYAVPHPSENNINLRIETYGMPATDVLKKGLQDLNELCVHVLETFEFAVEKYKTVTKSDADEDMDETLPI